MFFWGFGLDSSLGMARMRLFSFLKIVSLLLWVFLRYVLSTNAVVVKMNRHSGRTYPAFCIFFFLILIVFCRIRGPVWLSEQKCYIGPLQRYLKKWRLVFKPKLLNYSYYYFFQTVRKCNPLASRKTGHVRFGYKISVASSFAILKPGEGLLPWWIISQQYYTVKTEPTTI